MSETMLDVDAPQSPSVRFRREGDRLCVAHAPPVMWFARHALELNHAEPEVGLSFDGKQVTLRAANGRWIWRLTGRTCHHRYGPNGGPVVMVEGRWPD